METSAGFILFRDGKFLFLVHREGHLDFPKGHVEEGESLIEAAFREAEEEAGLGRSDIRVVDGFSCEMSYSYGRGNRKRVVLFLAEVVGGTPSFSAEHAGIKWVKIDEAEGMMRFEEQRRCIRCAAEFLREMGYI